MLRTTKSRALSRHLILAGAAFWAFSYLGLTARAAFDPTETLDFIRVKRAFVTFIGAGLYCLLLLKVASDWPTLRRKGTTLVTAGIAAALLLWVIRIAIDAAYGSDPIQPAKDAGWILVWLGFFLLWASGSAIFLLRAPKSDGPISGAAFPQLAALPPDIQLSEGFDVPRIAVVLSGLGAGGAERVVSKLANQWVERGWEASVISFEMPCTPSYYSYDPRVKLHRLGLPPRHLPGFSAAMDVFRRLLRLRQVLRQLAPEVIVSFLTRPNVLTLIAAAGSRVPVIVSERSNPELQNPGWIWNRLRLAFYPYAFAHVTMTNGARLFFPPNIQAITRIIPNPVSPPPASDYFRGGTTLVAVGRLEPVKGYDLLIRAFGEIASHHPSWRLVIWGEGSERKALEALRDALHLGDRVEFPGLSSKPGIWIESADAFVLSSHYEGWPNALMEAMAGGLPVVSTNCCWGPADMITDGEDGILIPPADVLALAMALSRLLGEPALRARLGAAARVSASRFSHDVVFANWDELVSAARNSATARRTRT